MTRIVIKQLALDKHNLEHIQKHNVTETEIKQAGKNLIYHRRSYKGRYLAIGRSNTRLITLVIKREEGKYYLVTARDASRKERRDVYAKEKKQNTRV